MSAKAVLPNELAGKVVTLERNKDSLSTEPHALTRITHDGQREGLLRLKLSARSATTKQHTYT